MRNRPSILLVEPDDLVRMLASECFVDIGFDVIEARTANEALQGLRTSRGFRAVLAKQHLPGPVDGVAVSRHARTLCPDCVVVLTSTGGVDADGDLAPGVLYVPKPYRPAHVAEFISTNLVSASAC